MKKSALSFALLGNAAIAQFVPAPVTNLGGGCVPATSALAAAGYTSAPLVWLQPQYGPGGGGSSRFLILSGVHGFTTTSPALQLVFLGFSDPNTLLPSCGCVLHTTFDVSLVAGPLFILNYPASAVGTAIYGQSVYVPTTSVTYPVPTFYYGPPFPFGCTEEPSLAPVLTDAVQVLLP